jgi:CheY-like chemotaxis protein
MSTALKAGRVVVIDDDPTMRLFLTTLLTDFGYQPFAWQDSPETWEALPRVQSDLFILNLGYRVRNTIDELEEFLLSSVCTLEIPIVLLSTDHYFLDRHADRLRGLCSAMIAMPFDVTDLLVTLSRLLDIPTDICHAVV